MSAPALPPALAARFRVGRLVGQGSIAQVFEAHDQQLGAPVALKVLFPSLRRNHVVVDRFRREVQVVRRIEHPHVIRIHDLLETPDVIALVMSLHAGGNLAERLAAGPLAPATLVELARQLGAALEAAHRAGVVHRDIKPHNVLVGSDPERLDTRLCDFGLARTTDLAGLTTRSTVLGTPEYMAPEVVAEGRADPRSDVYSMAVLLFEAATGRLPFRGDSPYHILSQHLSTPPPRLCDLAPHLPPAFDAAIARGLAKDPFDRFATAEELAAALTAPPAAVSTALTEATLTGASTCARCGGRVLDLAETCLDCGATRLRLRHDRRGVAVLVTGPGEPGDKLDGRSHVTLVRLLHTSQPGTVDLRRLRLRPPRVPFFLLDHIDETDADELVRQLGEAGFAARIERRAGLGPAEIRSKVRRMGARYLLTSFGALALWPLVGEAFLPGLVALAGAPLLLSAAVHRRPLLRPKRTSEATGTEARLASAIGRLRARRALMDVRLVARVMERLHLVEQLAPPPMARALADRAATVAEALALVAESPELELEHDLARAVARGDLSAPVAAALDRLRETERQRSVLVADLLRTWSRLDAACTGLTRARALEAGQQAAAVEQQIAALQGEVESEEEVTALLGTRSP